MTCNLFGEVADGTRKRLAGLVLREFPEDNWLRLAILDCYQITCPTKAENLERLRRSRLQDWAVDLARDSDEVERLRAVSLQAGTGVSDPFGLSIKMSEARPDVRRTFRELAIIIRFEGRRRGGRPTSEDVIDAAARLALWASRGQLTKDLVAREMGSIRWSVATGKPKSRKARNRVKQRVRRASNHLRRCLDVLRDRDPDSHDRWWLIAEMLGGREPVLPSRVA